MGALKCRTGKCRTWKGRTIQKRSKRLEVTYSEQTRKAIVARVMCQHCRVTQVRWALMGRYGH